MLHVSLIFFKLSIDFIYHMMSKHFNSSGGGAAYQSKWCVGAVSSSFLFYGSFLGVNLSIPFFPYYEISIKWKYRSDNISINIIKTTMACWSEATGKINKLQKRRMSTIHIFWPQWDKSKLYNKTLTENSLHLSTSTVYTNAK